MNLSSKAQDNLVGGCILSVLMMVIGLSLTYGPRARLVPLTVSVLTLTALLVEMFLRNTRSKNSRGVEGIDFLTKRGEEIASEIPVGEPDDAVVIDEPGGSARGGIGLVALFAALIYLFGILPATFSYVTGYLFFISKVGLVKALAYAGATWVTLYLLFIVLLGVPLYYGYVFLLMQ